MQRENRRLAAIVAADIAGYSRLIGQDEEGTLRALRAHRAELIDPLVEQHGGRIANTAGDSLLLEFPSAVDAVRCCIAVQEGMAERNSDVEPDSGIAFRIGINVGDVVAQSGDLLGDGVNIAARIEALAEPNGISVSDDAYRQVRDRLDVEWQEGGEHEVKNIARPVHVWSWSTSVEQASVTVSSDSEALPLPDKPSIAVLPFDNMSGDPEQEYFADGMTEDIITELSRFEELFVIARNTSFAYKGQRVDVMAVARELAVHFILEGSVRKMAGRVRITAQLINGQDGNHVWAERYDGDLEDVFELLERVTRQVVGSVMPEIIAAEILRLERGDHVFDEAHELAWRAQGLAQMALRTNNPEAAQQSVDMAIKAIEMNPNCSPAYSSLCFSYVMQSLWRWGDDPVGAADRAVDSAEKFHSLFPTSYSAFLSLGLSRHRKGLYAQADRDFRRAHELNPNDALLLRFWAWCEACMGEFDSATEHALLANRLSPKDYHVGISHLALAMASFAKQDNEQFLHWAELAIQAQPYAPIRRAMMVAYAANIGDQYLLDNHLNELIRFAPDFITSLFRGENPLFEKKEHTDMLLNGLRKAGFPE